MNNYDYPLGADNEFAPWNQKENDPIEVEVTVSISLSKTFKLSIDDYVEEKDVDEDGPYTYINYDDCDFYKAFKEQECLPTEINHLLEDVEKNKEAIKDILSNWNIDDMSIVKD